MRPPNRRFDMSMPHQRLVHWITLVAVASMLALVLMSAAQAARAPAVPTAAFVYVQTEERLHGDGEHIGPIAEYTLEHARKLRW